MGVCAGPGAAVRVSLVGGRRVPGLRRRAKSRGTPSRSPDARLSAVASVEVQEIPISSGAEDLQRLRRWRQPGHPEQHHRAGLRHVVQPDRAIDRVRLRVGEISRSRLHIPAARATGFCVGSSSPSDRRISRDFHDSKRSRWVATRSPAREPRSSPDARPAPAARLRPRRWNPTKYCVDGQQHEWPPVARPEDVPGPQDRRANAARLDETLAVRSNRDVRPHHRGRMCDAHVDEMSHPRTMRRPHGGLDRGEVHSAKLSGFGRIGVGRPDQVNEGGVGWNRIGEACIVERITDDRERSRRKFVSRLGSGQRVHAESLLRAGFRSVACRRSPFRP